MPNAPALFSHALRMLVHDPATTLRVLMPGIVLIAACTIGMAYYMPDQLWSPTLTPDQIEAMDASAVGGIFLSAIAGVAGYVLMAVLWHRYVLLAGVEEETSIFPRFRVIAGYVWRAFIIVLVQIAASLPILALAGVIATVGSLLLSALVAGVIFFWIALRISLILPAAAVGRPLKIADSWRATAPLSNAIWGLAAMLALLSTLVSGVISQVSAPGSGLMIWLQGASYIVEGLISISILTTLYGHLIEGRALD